MFSRTHQEIEPLLASGKTPKKNREHINFSHSELHNSLCEHSADLLQQKHSDILQEDDGFSLMAMYAVLSDDLTPFVARLKQLTQNAKGNSYVPYKLHPESYDIINLFRYIFYAFAQEATHIHQRDWYRVNLSNETISFLYLINLVQHPENFSEPFVSETQQVKSSYFWRNPAFLAPVVMDAKEEGATASANLANFSLMPNFYSKQSLARFFSIFKTSVDQVEIDFPIVIKLSTFSYRLIVGYYPDEQRWFLVDPGLGVKNTLSPVKLADYVFDSINFEVKRRLVKASGSFFPSAPEALQADTILFDATMIYAQQSLVVLQNTLEHSLEWNTLHNVDSVKTKMQSKEGYTLLHLTARSGDIENSKRLLLLNANPNASSRFGITPLLLAARQGNSEMISVLLEGKADPNREALDFYQNMTPLGEAVYSKDLSSVTLLANVTRDKSIAFRDHTTILLATQLDWQEGVEFFITAGVDVNKTAQVKLNSIRKFLKNEMKSKFERLLDDLFFSETYLGQEKWVANFSPLHMAVLHQNKKMIKALLESGADQHSLCEFELSAAGLARELGEQAIIDLFDISLCPLIPRGHID